MRSQEVAGVPESYLEKRPEVLERDDHECRTCGTEGGLKGDANLQIHHRVPRSEGGSDDLSNLLTLCESCHSKLHGADTQNEKAVTLKQVMDAYRHIPYPSATASDIAEVLGCSSETARVKLNELHVLGKVEKRRVGATAVVWTRHDWKDGYSD